MSTFLFLTCPHLLGYSHGMREARRVAWHYHIRITPEHRASLDVIARRFPVFRHSDGRPHDAELVRLLAISAAYQSEPVEERVALALRASAVLMFSQEFSKMLADLQADLGLPARREVGIGGGMPPRQVPDKEVTDSHPVKPRDPDYRCNIHLTVDDTLRTAISNRVQESGKRATTVARELFQEAMLDWQSHLPVITAYERAVASVREELRHVAEAGRRAIVRALRHPPRV